MDGIDKQESIVTEFLKCNKRATTVEAKTEVMLQLLELWKSCSNMRLGQLLTIAAYPTIGHYDIFYVEDRALVEMVQEMINGN